MLGTTVHLIFKQLTHRVEFIVQNEIPGFSVQCLGRVSSKPSMPGESKQILHAEQEQCRAAN